MADTSSLAAGSQATMKLENTDKRDSLIEIEKRYQKSWAQGHVFEVDAPTLKEIPASVSIDEIHEKYPKSFLTMAYPV
jgi:leucyl-tRNA synthetase